MADTIFRVHPAIGMARVGNSEEFYIAPETIAGMPDKNGGPQTGGLPIKAGTENQTITDADIRDSNGAFKRQAARFRIYQYPGGEQSYPIGESTEVTIGSVINGKKVADIIWTVHLANKKANCYEMDDDEGIGAYENCGTPRLRNAKDAANPNAQFSSDPNDPERLQKLMIDSGPRAIKASASTSVKFDKATPASYWASGDSVQEIANYPKSFPDMHFPKLNCPSNQNIETLGELQTEANGRLLVLGAYGTACGWYQDDGQPFPLGDDVNNDGWFDDVADGPVSATIVFDDHSTEVAQGGWVVTTDPGYAPQTMNVVALWDDIYNTFVEQLGLVPGMYSNGAYNTSYKPSFDDDVFPMFRAAALQQWNTNLPSNARAGHQSVDNITATDDPAKFLHIQSLIRNPNDASQNEVGAPRMPLSLGDAGKSFLSISTTQYFILSQWFAKTYNAGAGPALGDGEFLDKATLMNCLGGRFSPGIDMTFIVRQPELYIQDWQQSGPFRINPEPLDYSNVNPNKPFLSVGYIPLHQPGQCPDVSGTAAIEPGDTSKFMAIPWHTDYNSCATHLPSPQPPQELTLYWSWPAQRPVAVYVAKDVVNGQLGQQRFSVRGQGTGTDLSSEVGRFQEKVDMVKNWQKIGVVIQGTAIEGGSYPADAYLEVESQLDDSGDRVLPWPNTVVDPTVPVSS